jgi:hypothetical protein
MVEAFANQIGYCFSLVKGNFAQFVMPWLGKVNRGSKNLSLWLRGRWLRRFPRNTIKQDIEKYKSYNVDALICYQVLMAGLRNCGSIFSDRALNLRVP